MTARIGGKAIAQRIRARVAEEVASAFGGSGWPRRDRCLVMGILNVTPDSFSDGVPYAAMHWRAPTHKMHDHAVYCDVVADVVAELRRRAGELLSCGVGQDQIVLDPGWVSPSGRHMTGRSWPTWVSCTASGSRGSSARPVHDVRGSLDAVRVAAWNAPSGGEKGGDHAICGAVAGGVPAP